MSHTERVHEKWDTESSQKRRKIIRQGREAERQKDCTEVWSYLLDAISEQMLWNINNLRNVYRYWDFPIP